MSSQNQAGDEAATRRLVGSWLSRTPPDSGSGGVLPAAGLAVPEAPAEEVIATARRLATRGRRRGPSAQPAPELRLIAEAMVLDEHPSAARWSLAERREVLGWITHIIHRFGEDGVQRLVSELNARR